LRPQLFEGADKKGPIGSVKINAQVPGAFSRRAFEKITLSAALRLFVF
jgi:hypothetical protein